MTAIVVAVDGSLSSERAVHIAADIAQARRADVALISVIDDSPIPDAIRALAETEHVIDNAPQFQGTQVSNMPMWVADGVHAAVRAEQNVEIRRTISQLALEKAHDILGHVGVSKISDHIIEGDVVDAILEVAAREKAEMIVMGSRGLSAIKSFAFGSTSQQVTTRATCSCITVT